jgi:hypothetical protein
MHAYLMDNNLLNYACSTPDGVVISKLNEGLATLPMLNQKTCMTVIMTPFSLIEALGIKWTEIKVIAPNGQGARKRPAAEIVSEVISHATAAYRALPVLQPEYLASRVRERRMHIDSAALPLFNIFVGNKALSADAPEALANSLGYDYAFKCMYPKMVRADVNRFLYVMALLQPAVPTLSKFRVAKLFWDQFFTKGSKLHNPAFQDEIKYVNRSMRLKTSRDFLDCDLIHFACFGWGTLPVAAFTCDDPQVIFHRVAVYKGFIRYLINLTEGIPAERLPMMRHGLIVRCDPDGTITHIFPTESIPAIM